jgi:hypothetical protein
VVTIFASLWRVNLDAASFLRASRATFAGVLIGFLVGQAMALTWLALCSGKTVRERQSSEAASRNAAAPAMALVR